METNIRILLTIHDQLNKRWASAKNFTPTNYEGMRKQRDEILQDMKYSMDMLQTIISIEAGSDGWALPKKERGLKLD